MVDNLTIFQRSRVMSRIKSKWTFPEKKLHNFLKGNKIKHKMHPPVKGSPDVILLQKKVAIFIHGCFWHNCPIHYIKPKSNKKYWIPKIEANVKRDKLNALKLKKQSYRVIIIWEHELKNIDKVIKKLT